MNQIAHEIATLNRNGETMIADANASPRAYVLLNGEINQAT
jgi:hypothetical protein